MGCQILRNYCIWIQVFLLFYELLEQLVDFTRWEGKNLLLGPYISFWLLCLSK
ncbi:hypothetical protein BDA96_09G097400 [Sorghum bicolor]|uniref:Uncharacterized protein n=1 Tax=Sorghum bicolor TaxID=4558 RepID=A0A921Q8M0_SORBI|nr:hypothetical protein BDA96_09G097400 [Sorghum bicolor]